MQSSHPAASSRLVVRHRRPPITIDEPERWKISRSSFFFFLSSATSEHRHRRTERSRNHASRRDPHRLAAKVLSRWWRVARFLETCLLRVEERDGVKFVPLSGPVDFELVFLS